MAGCGCDTGDGQHAERDKGAQPRSTPHHGKSFLLFPSSRDPARAGGATSAMRMPTRPARAHGSDAWGGTLEAGCRIHAGSTL
ncbi:Hypothetical protein A7982_08279 [Minicystis rosea]|nr:Hypothetical protein A7982_08279 [Minicystis rosea]